LREIAEPIIREWVEEDAELRWIERTTRGRREVHVVDQEEEQVGEWSDGSCSVPFSNHAQTHVSAYHSPIGALFVTYMHC